MSYRLADGVAWVGPEELEAAEPVVYAAVIPDGQPVVLAGSGCLVWLGVANGLGLDDLVAEASGLTDAPASDVREEIVAFLESLVGAGLLVREQEPA